MSKFIDETEQETGQSLPKTGTCRDQSVQNASLDLFLSVLKDDAMVQTTQAQPRSDPAKTPV
ncbi:hypothetical protein [Hydrocarboniclastica marina]|uniref:hypothetical protein n=1 Tax=Hydrocarboniclastica marina TaxID=2259620 RepID=UPI0010A81840|nr:hypothetical protein [Hydrocarboniclastica marina]